MGKHFVFGILVAGFLLFQSPDLKGGSGTFPPRELLVHHVSSHYAEQLTNPQKKIRKTLSQFGYNLSYFSIPTFPITSFIDPHHLGMHSYSKPGRKEKNGCLYTCRGGFIDFSHLRAGLDWTIYLAFTLLNEPSSLDLDPEAGSLEIEFAGLDELTIPDLVDIAQKIAFERLTWHEIASWHYHPPYHMRKDDQSAFTPEDTYSNFLGTVIGKRIALRILSQQDTRPFVVISTEEIENMIASLQPVASKKESKEAYDLVDRYKQMKLQTGNRNSDVWWDSRIIFRDQRYIFKRDLDLGPDIDPWLVPLPGRAECTQRQDPEILKVPESTSGGRSINDYYTFTITPDTAMFYGRKGTLVHHPFSAFATRDFAQVMALISVEMEALLCDGFDRRDCCDPVNDFKNVRRVAWSSGSMHRKP